MRNPNSVHTEWQRTLKMKSKSIDHEVPDLLFWYCNYAASANRFSEISRTCMDYGLNRFTFNFYKNWHTRITPDLPNLSHTCSNNYPFPFQQLLYELWTKSLKNSILALFLKNDSSSTMPAFYPNDSIQNLLQLGECSRIIKIAKWSWRVRIYLDRMSTPGK